ncbi:cyclopropane-fatty-acyl-phospholipid synthase family protein [Bradyrhizobium sp. Tv2a-2]|uniref:SAM-dependent methyltransferase n=1 Tax=Bradyrhizobium sp. Tv2a-2 TaxID=113395 RepID=UPI001FDA48C8|nr:cyclopropane-fatty-acyl-phospholipid synthase family protein [Bradyrhizobium sp. Tv2a-2]
MVRLNSRWLHYSLAFNPGMSIAKAYMDGTLTIEEGTFYDFFEVLGRNAGRSSLHTDVGQNPLLAAAAGVIDWLRGAGSMAMSRKNVKLHYDLSSRLYDLFLDCDRQYSCAYFRSHGDALEAAQVNKVRHIMAKLLLERPGMKVLDIGSGWGGLALYIARHAGADVTGITLSTEQLTMSRDRAKQAELATRVHFELRDYRHETGRYDRVVTVGMLEHVGRRNYVRYFDKIGSLLKPDGVALVHSVASRGMPGPINPFIEKYIFPGAYLPSLSEVFAAAERAGLIVTDVEILRLHYAETLRHWRQRFMAHLDEARALYGERFCRMWEAYSAMCEVGFRHLNLIVFQMQLAKQHAAVPVTRDYMFEAERNEGPILRAI